MAAVQSILLYKQTEREGALPSYVRWKNQLEVRILEIRWL